MQIQQPESTSGTTKEPSEEMADGWRKIAERAQEESIWPLLAPRLSKIVDSVLLVTGMCEVREAWKVCG